MDRCNMVCHFFRGAKSWALLVVRRPARNWSDCWTHGGWSCRWRCSQYSFGRRDRRHSSSRHVASPSRVAGECHWPLRVTGSCNTGSSWGNYWPSMRGYRRLFGRTLVRTEKTDTIDGFHRNTSNSGYQSNRSRGSQSMRVLRPEPSPRRKCLLSKLWRAAGKRSRPVSSSFLADSSGTRTGLSLSV